MKCSPKSDFSLFLMSGFLLTTFLLHLVSTQPQVYFKASLPSKSLPRIGRRSDMDSQFPVPVPGSVDSVWNDGYNYNFNAYNNPRPNQIIFWKKMLAEISGDEDSSAPLSASAPAFGTGRDLYRNRDKK